MDKIKLIGAAVLAAVVIAGGSYLLGEHEGKKYSSAGAAAPAATSCPSVSVAASDVKKDSGSEKQSAGIKISEKKTTEPAAAGGQKVTEEKTTEASWDSMSSVDSEHAKELSILLQSKLPSDGIAIIPNYDFQSHEIQTALQYEHAIGNVDIDLINLHARCYAVGQANLKIDRDISTELRNLGAGGKCNW